MSNPSSLKKVVIVGGGVGALEAALALRSLAFDVVTIELVAPEKDFTYRPLSVVEPFGLGKMWHFELEAIASDSSFTLRQDALDRVDVQGHRIITVEGAAVDYDALIIAVGAQQRTSLPEALTFRGHADAAKLHSALANLDINAERIVFTSPGTMTWTLPLYELALLTAHWLKENDREIEVVVVTSEEEPLEAFGDEVSQKVTDLLASHEIKLRTKSFPREVDDSGLWLEIEGKIPADLVVTVPRIVGPSIPGLPSDSLGFIPVDEFTRVKGAKDVYAVGDSADWPIKQGGLAAQQADIAAAVIAKSAGAPITVKPYEPVMRGLLFTGEKHEFLRSPIETEEYTRPDTIPSGAALWWPTHKIAGKYLAPYLETRMHLVIREDG